MRKRAEHIHRIGAGRGRRVVGALHGLRPRLDAEVGEHRLELGEFGGVVRLLGTKEQRVRWKRGVSLVNGICGEDVGRIYVRKHFPESSKTRMAPSTSTA